MARRNRNSSSGNSSPGGRKLLINASESEESRIAVLNQGRLEEFYIERQSLGSTLGNIYKAKITNVEKSIGAAFVDFGHGRQGFLHVSDLCMEAVGGSAAELLASVQAAREVAHDEDVVEPRRARVARVVAPAAHAADAEDGEEPKADDQDGDDEAPQNALGEDDFDPLDADHGPEGTDELGGPGGDAGDEDDEDESGDQEVLGLESSHSDLEALPALEGSGADSHSDNDDDSDDAEDSVDDEVDSEEEGDDDEDEDPTQTLDVFGPLSEVAERARMVVEASLRDQRNAGGTAVAGRGGRRRRNRRGGRNRVAGPAPKVEASNGRSDPRGGRRDSRQMPPIEQVLQKGQEIVVQVIKDGIGTKGPTLTTYLSLPGRFIVLMPGIRKRGVSRKVVDVKERERLKDFVRTLEAPDELGFVVRTAGMGCQLEDLQRDLDYLLKLWEQMKSRTRQFSAPVLLYQENDLVIRTLRDLYDGQGEIVTDDRATADKAREFLQQIMPHCVERVQLYSDEKPLFSHYGLEAELNRLLQSRIELKSGGSLIIEQTEALVAVDVNSGRFKPENHKDIDDTGFQVNSEAAVEIARQIRLRDLGGVVVIDFIDMRYEKHRKQVERIFKDELRKDRARIKLARFSPFGILELTRQRVRPSLKRTVHQKCPYCDSTGYVPSDETSCLAVIRKVRENIWRPGATLVVTVRPEVAEAVLNTQKRVLADLEAGSRKQIFIRADHRLAYEDVEVRAMVTLPDAFDHRRA